MHVCLLITLFNILINKKKLSISVKEKQTAQGTYEKVTHIRIHKFMRQKRKFSFIPMKVQLITISSVIPYISEINSTSSSLKKKKKIVRTRRGGRREGERNRKRGRETEKERKRE